MIHCILEDPETVHLILEQLIYTPSLLASFRLPGHSEACMHVLVILELHSTATYRKRNYLFSTFHTVEPCNYTKAPFVSFTNQERLFQMKNFLSGLCPFRIGFSFGKKETSGQSSFNMFSVNEGRKIILFFAHTLEVIAINFNYIIQI